jgi:phage/plasmid-like protein (TIGR03299 family)
MPETEDLVRKVPWADITLTVDDDVFMSSREMLEAAGLDWDVEKVPCIRRLDDGSIVTWPGNYEIRKSDDQQPLGHVLSVYQPFQNRDAFAFGDHLVLGGKGRWVAAGQAYNNLQVMMVMQLTEELDFQGDIHRIFLLLTTTHNGTTGVRAMAVPFRMTCLNQMSTALDQASWAVSIRHTPSMKDRVVDAADALQRSLSAGETYLQTAEWLAAKKLDDHISGYLIGHAIKTKEPQPLDDPKVAAIMDLYQNSPTLEQWRGTGFGLLNALTEYENHYRKYRTGQSRYLAMPRIIDESARMTRQILSLPV